MNYFTPFNHVFQQQKIAEEQTTGADPGACESPEISRLLTAAVINREFQQLLLSDPHSALRKGFNNESFHFSPAEEKHILSIRARTLQEFAQQTLNVAHDSHLADTLNASTTAMRERPVFPPLRMKMKSA